jgi:murein L,D-transpeptidase YafK
MSPFIPFLHFFAVCLVSLSFATSAHSEIKIPRSEISKAAYQRLAPLLEQAMQQKGLQLGQPIFMRIFKEENELEVWIKKEVAYELFETYSICRYSGNLGPKLKEGDEQSPEGFYTVSITALNPWSNFHLSFNLGYPNEYDRLHQRTGSALMVHGKCESVGCFAMDDFRIEEIYTIVDAALSGGQEQFSVHIFPFRMTWDKMALHADSPWIPFWENLKLGYDYFQGHRTPPMVTVQEQQYAFHTFHPLLFGSDLTPVQPAQVQDMRSIAELRLKPSEEISIAEITIKPSNEKRYAQARKKGQKSRSAL